LTIKNSTILIKGSRGMALERTLDFYSKKLLGVKMDIIM
jgi:UDP-N-acetylmuramyl pentapeptide synthase